MGRIRIFFLTIGFVLISSLARPQDVCIFDSYGIDATKEVLKLLKERLKDSNGKNCRVKIIL